MNGPPADAQTKALEFVSRTANYSLVATLALLAWVASGVEFSSQGLRLAAMASLTLSLMFGIGTLALVPLVQEQRRPGESNFAVELHVPLFGRGGLRLKTTMLPQYVLLLGGTIFYVIGMID